MNGQYDCIILGTGLKECILSGLLSVDGLKVLHLDKNEYYGGESASLNLSGLFSHFGRSQEPDEKIYADIRAYYIDLTPKFILASGLLVQMLIKADVTKYLEFKSVDGSFVFKDKKVHKVPATDTEAVKSPLMGLLEKNRCRKFFEFVQDFQVNNPKTHKKLDLKNIPMKDVFKEFGLEPDTIDFIGHAMALYRDDDYLHEPALQTIEKVKLYIDSLSQHGKSPYIYPLYGLGDLPQAFARLSAIFGGTYMLRQPITEILMNNGVAIGVKSGTETAYARFVVGDPSYFPDKVKKVGQIVRAICILNHPIPHTNDSESCQIIIPQKQVQRKFDIYISMVSSSHSISPAGYYIAMVSTTVETNDPHKELQPGLDLLGPILDKFTSVLDVYEPHDDGTKNKIFISTSYDATSHFETTCLDVLDMYKRITGKDLDLTPKTQS